MNKETIEIKTKDLKPTSETIRNKKKLSMKKPDLSNWKPIAIELSMIALKGVITGFSLKLGSQIYETSVSKSSHSKGQLSLIEGGRKAG